MPGQLNRSQFNEELKTFLDGVVTVAMQEEMGNTAPYIAKPDDERLFSQIQTSDAAYTMATTSMGGPFVKVNNQQPIPAVSATAQPGVTYNLDLFGAKMPIDYFTYTGQGKWDLVGRFLKKQAISAVQARTAGAAAMYADLSGTTYPLPTGQPLLSTTHTMVNAAGTRSNKITNKLTPDSIEQMMSLARKMKDDNGVVVGFEPKTALVHTDNLGRMMQILDAKSYEQPGTADRNFNYISQRYGLVLKATPFLAENTNVQGTQSKDAGFLVGSMPGLYRIVRDGLITLIQSMENTDNADTIYRMLYSETYGSQTDYGVVGTDGSTGQYVN